jgi:hypothetical protein
VTRRLCWHFLKPGEIVNACVKCQGLGKGGKIERICQIRIVNNWPEYLRAMTQATVYGRAEVIREGFPGMTPDQFVAMFCDHMKVKPDQIVNRIEFEFLEDET